MSEGYSLAIKWIIFRHISQILPNIPMEQQINIVNWRIIHQPLQFTAFVYIPCNLGIHQSAIDGDHTSIGVFNLNAGGIDIERTV